MSAVWVALRAEHGGTGSWRRSRGREASDAAGSKLPVVSLLAEGLGGRKHLEIDWIVF
jgi:hypothetical protein